MAIEPTDTTRPTTLRRTGALGGAALLATGSVGALLAALATPAGAATTYTVDALTDGAADPAHCTDGTSGNCTLRDAAAAAADGDTIVFDASATGTITLSQGTIQLNAVTLTGPGSANLTIDSVNGPSTSTYNTFTLNGTGNAEISGVSIVGHRIRSIVLTGDLTLDDVSISDSYYGSSSGAAVVAMHQGDLTITNSSFTNNGGTTGPSNGGAIYARNSGDLIISDTNVTDNRAQNAGGGIMASGIGSITVTNSVVSGNDGGGAVLIANSSVDISESAFADNYGGGSGGGAYVRGGTTISVESSTFDGNSANGYGGGLYLSSSTPNSQVISSTISNNTITGSGGGVHVGWGGSDVVFANTTITGNSASSKGGGIYAGGAMYLTVEQSTVAANTASYGGGLFMNGGEGSLVGTILSANTATSGSALPGSADLDGGGNPSPTVDSDHSMIGGSTTNLTFTDLGGTITSSTPGLGSLADNGGTTMTMALLDGSAAIDAGPDPVPTFPGNAYDQRGIGFARIAYDAVDIGAFEVQAPPAPSTTSTSSTSTTIPDTTTTGGEDPVVPEFTG